MRGPIVSPEACQDPLSAQKSIKSLESLPPFESVSQACTAISPENGTGTNFTNQKIKEKQKLKDRSWYEHGTVYDNPLFTILDYREAFRKRSTTGSLAGRGRKGTKLKKYAVVALMRFSGSLFLLNCVVLYQPSSKA
jgi:hypothetical protein